MNYSPLPASVPDDGGQKLNYTPLPKTLGSRNRETIGALNAAAMPPGFNSPMNRAEEQDLNYLPGAQPQQFQPSTNAERAGYVYPRPPVPPPITPAELLPRMRYHRTKGQVRFINEAHEKAVLGTDPQNWREKPWPEETQADAADPHWALAEIEAIQSALGPMWKPDERLSECVGRLVKEYHELTPKMEAPTGITKAGTVEQSKKK